MELQDVKLTEVLGPLRWLGHPGLFISQSCVHWASSSSTISVQVAMPWDWFPKTFLLQYKIVILCICFCVSTTLGAVVCSVKSCWFSVCSAFYLLEWSGDFQASYQTGNWKSIYLLLLFYSILSLLFSWVISVILSFSSLISLSSLFCCWAHPLSF